MCCAGGEVTVCAEGTHWEDEAGSKAVEGWMGEGVSRVGLELMGEGALKGGWVAADASEDV